MNVLIVAVALKSYEMWIEFRSKDSRGCVIPMQHYDLLDYRWQNYRMENPKAKE